MNLAGWGKSAAAARRSSSNRRSGAERGDARFRGAETGTRLRLLRSCALCSGLAPGDRMDRGMVIFVGALLTFSSSWLGLVLFPFWQLQGEQPYQKDATDDPYPRPLAGPGARGQEGVPARTGACTATASRCAARSSATGGTRTAQMKTGADIKRGWGLRRTVSRDYIYDRPTMLGTMRTGPDLANVGSALLRGVAPHPHVQPAVVQRLEHHAVVRVPLHARRRSSASASEKALKLGREWTVDPGYRWRPSATRVGRDPRAARRLDPSRVPRRPGRRPIDLNTPEGKKRLLDSG